MSCESCGCPESADDGSGGLKCAACGAELVVSAAPAPAAPAPSAPVLEVVPDLVPDPPVVDPEPPVVP